MRRTIFGRRSEPVDADQLDLGLDDLEADIAWVEAKLAVNSPDEAPVPAEAAEGREGRDRDWPRHLPHNDVSGESQGVVAGAGETIARMLDYVPAQIQVLRIRRP